MGDKDKILDSIAHLEERSAKLKSAAWGEARTAAQDEANRAVQQEQRERASRLVRADELETKAVLLKEIDSREQLLDRIRQMREEKPPEIVHVPYLSPAQQEQLELEQKAGREAVAKAEADAERYREARLKAERETQAKEGTMVPVHHPNPGQDEQYPATKATLGKVKK